MTDFLTDFEWQKCPEGFRVIKEGTWLYRDDPDDPDRDGESCPKTDVIVANGNMRKPYYPIKTIDNLYSIFANVRTAEGLLDFVKEHGPLTEAGFATGLYMDDGESVPRMLDEAKVFRELLAYKKRGSRQLASFFDEVVRGGWGGRLIANVAIESDPKKGVRLKMNTDDLIDALWWQLAHKLSDDVVVRECRHCGQWFEAGPSAGKRVDSEFCCGGHRIRFNSLKRSRGK
jgi:hypothetical protein